MRDPPAAQPVDDVRARRARRRSVCAWPPRRGAAQGIHLSHTPAVCSRVTQHCVCLCVCVCVDSPVIGMAQIYRLTISQGSNEFKATIEGSIVGRSVCIHGSDAPYSQYIRMHRV